MHVFTQELIYNDLSYRTASPFSDVISCQSPQSEITKTLNKAPT